MQRGVAGPGQAGVAVTKKGLLLHLQRGTDRQERKPAESGVPKFRYINVDQKEEEGDEGEVGERRRRKKRRRRRKMRRRRKKPPPLCT